MTLKDDYKYSAALQEKFCKKASRAFYLTYFIIFIVGGISGIFKLLFKNEEEEEPGQQVPGQQVPVRQVPVQPVQQTDRIDETFRSAEIQQAYQIERANEIEGRLQAQNQLGFGERAVQQVRDNGKKFLWHNRFSNLFTLIVFILTIHPLWTIKFLTFPVPDKDLSLEIKERIDKLTRKRKSIKKLRKRVSIPFLVTLGIFLGSSLFIGVLYIISIFNAANAGQQGSPIIGIFISIFFMILLVSAVALGVIYAISIIWQIAYLVSSLWKLFTAKWYNPKATN